MPPSWGHDYFYNFSSYCSILGVCDFMVVVYPDRSSLYHCTLSLYSNLESMKSKLISHFLGCDKEVIDTPLSAPVCLAIKIYGFDSLWCITIMYMCPCLLPLLSKRRKSNYNKTKAKHSSEQDLSKPSFNFSFWKSPTPMHMPSPLSTFYAPILLHMGSLYQLFTVMSLLMKRRVPFLVVYFFLALFLGIYD